MKRMKRKGPQVLKRSDISSQETKKLNWKDMSTGIRKEKKKTVQTVKGSLAKTESKGKLNKKRHGHPLDSEAFPF